MAAQDMEQQEHSDTDDESVKWYNQSKNWSLVTSNT